MDVESESSSSSDESQNINLVDNSSVPMRRLHLTLGAASVPVQLDTDDSNKNSK